VNPKPTIILTSPLAGALILAPTNVPLVATAFDAYGAVSNVVFFADGVPLATDTTSPYAFTWSNAPTGAHTLHAVVTDNEGATNTSANVVIEIIIPPAIVMQPTDQAVYVSETATFTVVASGSSLTFEWRKDGVPIPHATGALLTLPNVQPGDAAHYMVRVSNSSGALDSTPATLTVKPWPTLALSQGANRLFLTWPEADADFKVETTTNLAPPVVWETVPGGPFIQDGKWTVVLQPEPISQSYFRLHKP
jgi:hypothetical protein